MLWFKNDFGSIKYLKVLFLMLFVIYRWHRGSTHRDSAGRIPCQSSLLYPWWFFFSFLICIYLFSLRLCWVFVAACRLSLAVASGGYSVLPVPWLLIAMASLAVDRVLQGAQASVVAAPGLSSFSSRAPEYRLIRCGTRAQVPCSMWDLPRPGIEPVSLALQGGFLTTGPPGKPLLYPWCFNHSEVCFVFSFNKNTLTCDIS